MSGDVDGPYYGFDVQSCNDFDDLVRVFVFCIVVVKHPIEQHAPYDAPRAGCTIVMSILTKRGVGSISWTDEVPKPSMRLVLAIQLDDETGYEGVAVSRDGILH